MKLMNLFFLLMTIVSCGKEAGGKKSENKTEQETLTMSGEETALKEKLMKKRIWKQSELLKTIILTKGTTKLTLRKLDSLININCNGTTGSCSLSPKG